MAPEVFSSDKAVFMAAAGGGYTPTTGRSYVTFLAWTGDYVKGVVGLAKGLRKCPDKVTWLPADGQIGPPPPLYFNASMFVFEPSRSTYNALLEKLVVSPTMPFAE
ncbi:hypothetical protein LINGRAHAP2_LOCUS17899 [Linum grandiflorum]